MTVNALCVFCGSAEGTRPADVAAARTLGTALAQRGIAVVYGGARTGLMGAVADAALAARGPVIGVIPRMLVERERAHPGLTQLHVVDSMAERKARMAELCDGFLALPGGIGTLEELVEVLSWARLGLHTKPCGILDLDGFYAPLFDFLDGARAAGFITAADDVLPARATTVEELLPAVLGRLGDNFAGPAPR